MTLEEAIAHHEWAAENCDGEVRDEHLQMVSWLEELVRLKRENAKLRELVKAMKPFLCCMPFASCNTLAANVRDRMRELRIEATDA